MLAPIIRAAAPVALAAVLSVSPALTGPDGARAGGMPPEFADEDRPVAITPAPEPAPAAQPVVARPVAPAPLEREPALPEPPPVSPFSVTYAEAVGYFSRYGYEATKRDAQLYCAQYGRIAVLDVRFQVDEEWYVRFDCVPPR